MPRIQQKRTLCLAMMVSMVALWSVVPVAAQVTYSVFPANPSQSAATAAQPTGQGAGSHVTLTVQDSTVEYAVTEIARQAHLRPYYNNHNPLFARRISVRMSDVTAVDALADVLRGTGLVAKLTSDGETVVISAPSGWSSAEHARLSGGIVVGRVTDSASGQGLGGASIKVAGTKLAAVTSDSGHFILRDVPSGDQVLTVRLFGYKPVERTVTVVDSRQTSVHLSMVPVPTVLSGVVTTAAGLQRRVEVGNDITSLNVDSIMHVAPVSSITDILETRVPGLTVLHSSGVPGAPSRLRIRGAGSINGNNDPIFIVDGIRVYSSQSDRRNNALDTAFAGNLRVRPLNNPYQGGTGGGTTDPPAPYATPSPLDQIDPNEIETIDVFKGPSAAALYGSDAANGVVVITTKRGRAGPTHWSLNVGQGVNWLPGTWPVNYYRFGMDSITQGYTGDQSGFCQLFDQNCKTDSIVAFQALNDPRYTVFSHGTNRNVSLTVSGGVPTLQYSLTGSGAGNVGDLKLPGIEKENFERQQGSIPGWMVRPDNYQTWSANGSLTAHPYPNFMVTLQSALFNSDQQQGSLQLAIAELQGEYIPSSFIDSKRAPLIDQYVERATLASLSSTNAVTFAWTPVTWLPLNATAGVNTIQRTDQTYLPYGINPDLSSLSGGDTTGGYSLGRGVSQDKTVDISTNIPALLHNHLTLSAGGNMHIGSTEDMSVFTTQLAPGVSTPTSFFQGADCTDGCGTQITSSGSTYGWFIEPRIHISDRFFAAPGFRLDGGSASGTQGGFSGTGLSGFPKVDLSYVAVDQSHPRGIVTLLRPRLAFGYAGIQPGPTQKLRLFNLTNGGTPASPTVSLNDATTLPAVFVGTIGNTQLQPERSGELEGGFDVELWEGRVSLTYSQYDKTRHNAIISVPLAPSVLANGFINQGLYSAQNPQIFPNNQSWLNIGEIRNTGTELTFNYTPLQSRALSWTVGGNLSNDNNVVVHLGHGVSEIQLGNNEILKAGYPLFSQWTLPIVSFVDANHDGIIEPGEIRVGDSLVYVGQVEPKYQVNFNTGITLLNGRLSVNATFAYQNGMTQTNVGALQSGALLSLLNKPGTPLATQAGIVSAECAINDFCGNGITKYSLVGLIQTVNTFRFNDLSVNYTIPMSIAHWFHVPHMMLALQGSNLGLHSNYRGKDPNVNSFATVSAGDETADLGAIPEPRTWWLKLTIGN